METECSKRVYQGVRVKHTVKDLLAEKRSRQTNGPRYTGVSTPPSPFVQMSGSHMLPSYYGMRRPFISDADFTTKPFPADVYPSSLTGKSLACDTGCMSGYSSLIDSYYPESFGDYRSSPFSSGGSTIFSSSALSSLLPSYPSDPSHYLLRDSWEPTGTEPVEGLCGGEGLAPVPLSASSSLVNPETTSPTQFRSSSRGSSMTSSQSYSLHSLDEINYNSSFQSTSGSFASASFMTEPATKLSALPSDDTDGAPPALSDGLAWAKEDSASAWSQYEVRRVF